jgi:hypothetical protein
MLVLRACCCPQTARSALPGVFAGKMGWAKGDPSLKLTDARAHSIVDRFTKQLRPGRLYDRTFDPEQQEVLAKSLSGMVPPTARSNPILPDELLLVLPLFVAETAGACSSLAWVCRCLWQRLQVLARPWLGWVAAGAAQLQAGRYE